MMKDAGGIFRPLPIVQALNSRKAMVLPAVFIALWFCSVIGFYLSISYKSETGSVETIAKTPEVAANEELRLLKKKSAAFSTRRVDGDSLPECSQTGISPFRHNSDKGNEKIVLHEAPPAVKVRAVGALGELKVAILDIGIEEGRMVGEGDVFGTKGRILRIGGEGVIWAWGSSQYKSLIWE